MAQNTNHIKSTYPLPVYNYRVAIQADGDPIVMGFSEVSGLNIDYEPVIYRHGFSFVMGNKIIPGMRQPTRITLKRGIVQNSNYLQKWLNDCYKRLFSVNAKRDILIDLCDETGVPIISWHVQDAMPIKLEAPTFDANSNDVAIESMEFIAHGLTIDYDPSE